MAESILERVEKYTNMLHKDDEIKDELYGYDQLYIRSNLDRIEALMARRDPNYVISSMPPEVLLRLAVEDSKVTDYMARLNLSSEEQANSWLYQETITENLREVDLFLDAENVKLEQGVTDKDPFDSLKTRLDAIRTYKYFLAVHPDFEQMTNREKNRVLRDREIISEHLVDFDNAYSNEMAKINYGASTKTIPEVIKEKVNDYKAREYFEILYPEFDSFTHDQKMASRDDFILIMENIDEIDDSFNLGLSPDSSKEANIFMVNAIKSLRRRKEAKIKANQSPEEKVTVDEVKEVVTGTKESSIGDAQKAIHDAIKSKETRDSNIK